MLNVYTYLLLFVTGLSGGLGDVWIYHWAKSGSRTWLTMACLVWLVCLISFGLLFKVATDRSLTTIFILSTMMHVAFVLACDVFWFGGRLNRVEWVGMVLGLVAVVLMEAGHQPQQ